jgi:hypothetical protein
MGTITKTVQQHMKRFLQKQIKLDELTQRGWEDAAVDCREQDEKYGTSELSVPVVVQAQTNEVSPVPTPTTFGEVVVSLDIVHGISRRPQGTSQQ